MRTAAQPPNPIALLDSAFDLLRAASAPAWLVWAAGSLPFGLAAIGFVSEMTSSANAAELLPAHAFALALLFLWMTASQALFSRRLWPVLTHATPTRSRPALATQTLIGSTALLMLPLSALSILGLPWAATFYYSASAYPGSTEDADGGIFRYASRQASTWAFSSVLDLAVTSLLGVVVFVNVLVLLIAGPMIFRMITGEETVFTTNSNGLFTSTLFAAAVVITWLAMDPVLRALYVIRCFRVDAIRTGVDLKASLARFTRVAMVAVLLVLCGASLDAANGPGGRVANPPQVGSLPHVDPQKLDRSIREVTRRPEFLWQEPREAENAPSTNAFIRFTQDAIRFIGDTVRNALEWIGGVIRAILRWLMGEQRDVSPEGPGGRDVPFAAPALYVLMAVVAGGVIALLMRLRIQRRRKAEAVPVTAGADAVDLASEDVSPDQAPEDAWLAMAARLLEAGDLRLATRALYLAVLASLGDSGLITINRARSNLDYQRELARRARGNAGLLETFRGLVAVFERTWYGEHPMSRDAFDRFRAGALEMRARGQA